MKHVNQKIAIVGLANLYPNADTPEQFWQNLLDKKDSRTTIDEQKLGADVASYRGEQGQSDRFYCDKGGYIQNFTFDSSGYQLSPEQLEGLDDSFLWALDTSRKALLDAGIDILDSHSAKLARTGVIMGTLSFPTARSNELFLPLYHSAVEKALQNKLSNDDFRLAPFNGASGQNTQNPQNGAIAHNASKVVADALGLGSAQLSLDAACASSVYSLKLACDYLSTGKADMMLAGAVSGADPFFINMGFSIFHAYPEHGISAPFDTNSKGLFAGEGAGVLVLKRLEDAERDGDKIYAVVNGIGLSNDGKGQFVLSPNSKGQIQAFERAYECSDIRPDTIEVIECHATGTPLGDKVELTSMERFFEDKLAGTSAPLIGSAKSNLSHLLTAAGMPGIMKMIFAMQTGQLPPSINLSTPISSPDGLFGSHSLPTQVTPWPVKEVNPERHAGVSVFGFGGCNAHLLLESYSSDTPKQAQKVAPTPAPISLAVTGIASHFGSLASINALNHAIASDGHGFTHLPDNRWKGLDKHPELLARFGLEQVPQGSYVDGFELDFLRFKLPPNEDDRLIPQQLMLMKVADEAINDAQLKAGQKVAVLVAMETELELHQFRGRVNLHTQLADSLQDMGVELDSDEYQALETLAMDSVLDAAKLNQYTSFIGNIMASRIASLWDFNGPAFTISAGDQSVSRALDVAENLMSQEHLDAVVIAAVDLSGSIEQVMLKNQLDPVAINPNHHTEDNQHWRIGEGAGAIVLEQDAKAKAEGKGSYANLNGLAFGSSNQAPHISETLLKQTGLNSQAINLLERNLAPGSEGLAPLAIAQMPFTHALQTQAEQRLGHSFAASGMASLLHGLLSLTQLDNPIASQPSTSSQGTSRHGIVANISENQCSQLLFSQTGEQRQALSRRLDTQVKAEGKLSLVKRVELGGRDIYQHIVDTPLDQNQTLISKLANKRPSTLALSPVGSAVDTQPHPSEVSLAVASTIGNQISMTNPNQPSLNAGTPPLKSAQTTHADPSELKVEPTTLKADASDVEAFNHNQQLTQAAHSAFLASRKSGLQLADAIIQSQLGKPAVSAPTPAIQTAPIAETVEPELKPNHANVGNYVAPVPEHKPCIWDYHDLVEYAEGDIAKVFGPDYAVIDSYSRRVRLPTTDYLLVSRVTKLDAKMLEFKPSTMTTEYDIPVDAPYLVDGQIPWAVAVESGQCDLMLISYLGVDFENKGDRVYRLLDCTLTFLGDLPRGGDTLRYDISINNFARNGDTLLFFFSYECFVGDKMILKMDGGCAGFFTDQELADGKGVIRTEDEIKARNMAVKQTFNPLLHTSQSQFNYGQIHKLLSGDIGACFGGEHATHQAQTGIQDSLCFASEKFLMIEEISKLERQGGAWGLGLVEGHKTLAPDHWYFPCHFKGDQVMAGSLMAEGCGQLLQFFMLHLGMHTQVTNGRFQPLENASQKVRCRGQVLPQHGTLTYRMEVTEIGLSPYPYAKANIDILLNGKAVVDFQNLGVMIREESECTRYAKQSTSDNTAVISQAPQASQIEPESFVATAASVNAPLMAQIADLEAEPNKGVIPLQHVEAPITPDYPNRTPDTVPFTPYHMFEFATGNIENCFGPDFAIYRGMIPPRTPCGDLQLTTRVVEVNGTRGDFKTPSSCIAEYEVPENAWYFSKNSHHTLMPYSVLMEISLQPNGFISGYMGTTLGFPGEELFFRNLDGSGKMLRNVDLRGKTIVNDSKLLSTVMAGTNIIQSFSFELSTDGQPFYEGTAVFGYFKAAALKDQLGLDNGKVTQPWHLDNGQSADHQINLLDKSSRYFNAPAQTPHYRLAGGQLNFIDKVEIVDKGGKAGKGYLYAERTIDPSDWFFQFHFHQDPVMPGSLGVEAIIELMQTYALTHDLGKNFNNPKFGQILSEVKWKYRGQINPLNKQMSLDVHITDVREENGQLVIVGDANLSKDGLRIYQISDIAICIEEA